ncbi:MAG: hypothetical protein U0074_05610 [Kouleothrix sp.]
MPRPSATASVRWTMSVTYVPACAADRLGQGSIYQCCGLGRTRDARCRHRPAQARIDYETARQNEITGLQDAEAKVSQAQTALDTLRNPEYETVAAARAALASAEARLAQLTGAQRQGSIQAQQGNVAAAKAQLDALLADPKTSDLARAEAKVAQAQAQLVQTSASSATRRPCARPLLAPSPQ